MVASDGIALSADGQTLYFCPLSSRHLYSVPTALLRDPSVSETQLDLAIKDLGDKGTSDGLEADAAGAVYAGYLYVMANQLHRQAIFHAGKDLRQKPYSLLRVKIDAAPAH